MHEKNGYFYCGEPPCRLLKRIDWRVWVEGFHINQMPLFDYLGDTDDSDKSGKIAHGFLRHINIDSPFRD
jgi:glycyl-tRNA synthetase alpha subunit